MIFCPGASWGGDVMMGLLGGLKHLPQTKFCMTSGCVGSGKSERWSCAPSDPPSQSRVALLQFAVGGQTLCCGWATSCLLRTGL